MNKVIIIAEAGVNHNGSLENAFRLIEAAVDAGVDYVKFQTFKSENLVSKAAKKAEYQIENTGKAEESQFEMLRKLELSHEQLDHFLKNKRVLAEKYKEFFTNSDFQFAQELTDAKANYWLNAVILKNVEQRDAFLTETNANNVMTRPVWDLMSTLPMFENCQNDGLKNSIWLAERVVNLPSSYRP